MIWQWIKDWWWIVAIIWTLIAVAAGIVIGLSIQRADKYAEGRGVRYRPDLPYGW